MQETYPSIEKKMSIYFVVHISFFHFLSVGPIILSIPQYFALNIRTHEDKQTNKTQYYMHYEAEGDENGNHFFFRLTLWMYSFILKFIPSIILTVFTGFLIHALYKAEERSARLKQSRGRNNEHQVAQPQQQPATQPPQQQPPASPPDDNEDGEEANGRVTTSCQTSNKHLRVGKYCCCCHSRCMQCCQLCLAIGTPFLTKFKALKFHFFEGKTC